jgi:hypothetical protein
MIWDIAHVADWQYIKQGEPNLRNNIRENKKRIDYGYAVSKSIMKIKAGTLKMEQPREGPFNIVRVHLNGTITTQKGPSQARLMYNKSFLTYINLIREESAVRSKNALLALEYDGQTK